MSAQTQQFQEPDGHAVPQLRRSSAAILRLLTPHRGQIALALILGLLARAAGLVLPLSFRFFVDRVLIPANLALLPALLLVVLLATALQALATFALTRTLSFAGERMLAAYRTRAQQHVVSLPVSFFDTHATGSLTARIMKDAGGVRDLLGPPALETLLAALTCLLAFAALLWIDPRLALPLLALLALVSALLRFGSRHTSEVYQRCGSLAAAIAGRLTQSLAAVRVVKIFVAEQREAALFAAGVRELANCEVLAQRLQARAALRTQLLLLALSPACLWLAANEVRDGRLTLGALASFGALLGYAVAAARRLGGAHILFARALAALRRTEDLLQRQPEGAEPRRSATLPKGAAEIRFHNVSFAYQTGKPVLHDVSFTLRPGTVTALVGASGAGKSTIMALACGFYAPTSGRITLGGPGSEQDLAALPLGAYRNQLGIVPQSAFLFSDSVRDNILFARNHATQPQFQHACAASHVDEFAARLSSGYDTLVGERGIKLSGGQQQRICLARAVLAQPRILLLDEATSSLDSESEALVQASARSLMQGCTTLVIAHRLSTIRLADQILVIADGAIVERGTHAELLARQGHYHRLATAQTHNPRFAVC
jgi:subfamily B ATP-binding cassette protein MsbA